MDQNAQNNRTVMLLLGCGALLMIGLCVVTGIGGYMFLLSIKDPEPPVVIAPTSPQPFPQQQPQPFPSPQPQQPTLPPPPQPSQSGVRVQATVTFVSPNGPVPSGATCDFQVEFPNVSQEMCRAQVYCNGRHLYGGPTAGYFSCTPGPGANVTGQDANTTANDTDASFSIATPASIITIRDDASGPNGAYTLTAHVDSVQ